MFVLRPDPAGGAAVQEALKPSDQGEVLASRPAATAGDALASPVGLADGSGRKSLEREAAIESQVQEAMRTAEVPREAAGTGTGTITGRVVNLEGKPVAGVVIHARHGGPMPVAPMVGVGRAAPSGGEATRDLEKRVRMLVSGHAALRRATTDGNGFYSIGGLEDRPWRLSAFSEGYDCRLVRTRPFGAMPGNKADFVAERVFRIPVSVLKPSGQAVSEARILISPSTGTWSLGGTSREWTTEQASVALPAGTWQLRAVAEPLSPYQPGLSSPMTELASEALTIDVPLTSGRSGVKLTLKTRSGIVGRVLIEDDRVLAKTFQVKLLPFAGGQEPDLKALGESARRSTMSGGTSYQFADLDPGTYLLGVVIGYGRDVVAHQVVEVGSGITSQDLVVPELDVGDFLLVRVRNTNGQPVRHLKYSFDTGSLGRRSYGSIVWPIPSTLGGDLLPLPAAVRDTDQGTYALTVTHEVLGSREVELGVGVRATEVLLSKPAGLVVTLTGAPGELLGRLAVEVGGEILATKLQGAGNRRPGVDGRVKIEGLAAGEVTLNLLLTREGGRSAFGGMVLGTWQQTVHEGDNEMTLAVPTLYELEVLAPDHQVGASVSVSKVSDGGRRVTGSSMRHELDSGLRAVFQHVPAGRYTVLSRGCVSAQVDVPSGPVMLQVRK